MTWKPDNDVYAYDSDEREIIDAENFSRSQTILTEKANIKSAIDQRIEEMAVLAGKIPKPGGMSAPELLKKKLDELNAAKAAQELADLEAEVQRNEKFGTWS